MGIVSTWQAASAPPITLMFFKYNKVDTRTLLRIFLEASYCVNSLMEYETSKKMRIVRSSIAFYLKHYSDTGKGGWSIN